MFLTLSVYLVKSAASLVVVHDEQTWFARNLSWGQAAHASTSASTFEAKNMQRPAAMMNVMTANTTFGVSVGKAFIAEVEEAAETNLDLFIITFTLLSQLW